MNGIARGLVAPHGCGRQERPRRDRLKNYEGRTEYLCGLRLNLYSYRSIEIRCCR